MLPTNNPLSSLVDKTKKIVKAGDQVKAENQAVQPVQYPSETVQPNQTGAQSPK